MDFIFRILTFDLGKEIFQVPAPLTWVLPTNVADDFPNGYLTGPIIGNLVSQVHVQPLVEFHQVREELSACLQPTPLQGEAGEEGNVLADHVARAEDTVSEILLRGIVGIVQLQVSGGGG